MKLKFNKPSFNRKHILAYLLLIIFNFAISSEDWIQAQKLVGRAYVINDGSFSQTNSSASSKSASFKLQGTIDSNLGNITTQGQAYSTAVSANIIFDTPPSPSLNLGDAHVFPNPCKVYEGNKYITFIYLTSDAVIKIYTIAGELVRTLNKSGTANLTNRMAWDLKNNEGETVASGIYIYLIKYRGMVKKGKIVLIR